MSCAVWSPVCSAVLTLSAVPSSRHTHTLCQSPGFHCCFTSTSTFWHAAELCRFFMNELSLSRSLSFFLWMRGSHSLPLSLCDAACRWICEWSGGEIDRRPLRLSLSLPSLTHKLPSNHRRVGWLMLYTHTHTHTHTDTYTLKQSQYSTWVLYSSLLTSVAPLEMVFKCVINTLSYWFYLYIRLTLQDIW